MSRTIESLQVMRAVAACSVVFTHIFGAKFPFLGSSGIFGVDIFFVLSGFLMTVTYKEERSGLSFLKGRITRIYPIYILISLPLILWDARKDTTHSLFNIYHNLTLLPTISGNFDRYNYVCWTLTYEMYFYVVMAVSMYLFKGVRKVVLITIVVMTLLFIFFGGLNNGPSGWADNSIHNILTNYIVLDFMIGSLIGLIYKEPGKKKSSLLTVFAAIIFLSVSSLLTAGQPDPKGEHYQIYTFFVSGIPASFLILISLKMRIDNIPFIKVLLRIGNASYSIYLSHLYIKLASQKINLPGVVVKPISYLVAIVIGCIVFEFIEKRLSLFCNKNKRLTQMV